MAREFIMGARIVLRDMFSREMRNAADRARHTRDELGRFTAQTKRASMGISGLGGAVKAFIAGAAIKKGWDFLVQGNADMETYQNTLAIVMKSQEKAVETLAWANKFAAQTPFEIPQVIEATTRMTSYGINAEKTLGIVGDMASVMGKDLMQAVEAVADAQTGELERLKEFGITKTMLQEKAKQMKIVFQNNKGQITDQKAMNAVLFSLMEDRYKGGMDLQSKTFKGMMSNAEDFIGTMGRQLGKPLFDKIKVGLGDTMAWLEKLQENGTIDKWAGRIQQFGGIVFRVFTGAFGWAWQQVKKIKDGITSFYNTNKPQIERIGGLFSAAFDKIAEYATPIITWLKDDAIPGLVTVLSEVGQWVLDVATWFMDNWSMIEPLVIGIAIAWGTYYAVTKSIFLATKIWTGAQWLLNAALSANPIGLVITAIGLLIGAGILLVKNWDKVKAAAVGLGKAIAGGIKSGVNWAIDILNAMINGLNQAFSFDLPKWLGGGHFELGIPNIPKLQIDGSHKTGLPNVPFDNYLAQLHKGERVLTAEENRAYSGAVSTPAALTNNSTAATSVTLAEGAVVVHAAPGQDVESLAEIVVTKLVDQVKAAGQVMGTTTRGALLNG